MSDRDFVDIGKVTGDSICFLQLDYTTAWDINLSRQYGLVMLRMRYYVI